MSTQHENGSGGHAAKDSVMTLDAFEALAEAYGGDIARWPAAAQTAARALAAADSRAERALSEAAALDAIIAADSAPQVSAALTSRVLEDAAGVAAERASAAVAPAAARSSSRFAPDFWRRLAEQIGLDPRPLAAGLAAAIVAGLSIGALGGPLDTILDDGQTDVADASEYVVSAEDLFDDFDAQL